MSTRGAVLLLAGSVLFLAAFLPQDDPVTLSKVCDLDMEVQGCFEKYYNDVLEWEDQRLFTVLGNANWVGFETADSTDCKAVAAAVDAAYFMGGAALFGGMPKAEVPGPVPTGGHVSLNTGTGIIFHANMASFPGQLLSTALHEAGHYAGYGHTGSFTAYDASSSATVFVPEEEDDPPPTPTLPPTPTVPSVNPNGYPVLGQDVSCTYVFNPLGGDLCCKGLTINAGEGWYFEERLGVAFWFSSNADGTASATVCRPDGEWEKVCEEGDG